MNKNLTVVTGTRAEPVASTIHAVESQDDLTLSLIATGMHLSPQHGMTVKELQADGFTVDKEIHMLLDGDSSKAMAKSLGIGTASMAEALDSLDTDITVVIGDRDEGLAAALASAHMNIPVAHIHGGDVMSGSTIDDSIRHAITKFSHIHYPATDQYATNIEKLGEEPWRIFVVGSPGLDAIHTNDYTPPEEILEAHDLNLSKSLALVVQHPLTAEPENAPEQMRTTLSALESFDGNIIVIYPNADAGGKAMIETIESWAATMDGSDRTRTFKSLPRKDYLGLMDAADVMIGNSSSGVVEAPSFNLPVVDVGPRQTGRIRATNTIAVDYDTTEIENAIYTCLTDEQFRREVVECSNPYYYGGAGKKIVSHLSETTINDKLLKKQMTY
ncbi:UDP-N-acetylglucosamine 2-epimerase (non-hydrolysing)/GDP/UDP-N,N'-diacetylbacillosamine 2-epimerase (hydrolysing) [Halohasta litchfieldiae]|jgi:UDP-N-acetylglucosamine 2-epimerase (non-hydrolysing)/GDP/UDP-N,N'-diacetylbacillosamine 2-epimerase (hydrolysing)|nr:UDP-N-acetylglucosamine 2-epimerase [Halohasta litchfieldiae]ATW89141.1 UDP-N-acetylglucosamine 2-epimerase (non-hydrolysing)/GDP/UDP-N,N'-diacetylbacillosamine 2-epimerase (hydrolysing) [Halohasta litchfieldiae]